MANTTKLSSLGLRSTFLARERMSHHFNSEGEVRFGREAATQLFAAEKHTRQRLHDADDAAVLKEMALPNSSLGQMSHAFRTAGNRHLDAIHTISSIAYHEHSDVTHPDGRVATSEPGFDPKTLFSTSSDGAVTVSTGKNSPKQSVPAAFSGTSPLWVTGVYDGEEWGGQLEGAVQEMRSVNGMTQIHLEETAVVAGSFKRQEGTAIRSLLATASFCAGEAKQHLLYLTSLHRSVALQPAVQIQLVGYVAELMALLSMINRAVADSTEGLPLDIRAMLCKVAASELLVKVYNFRHSVDLTESANPTVFTQFPQKNSDLCRMLCANYAERMHSTLLESSSRWYNNGSYLGEALKYLVRMPMVYANLFVFPGKWTGVLLNRRFAAKGFAFCETSRKVVLHQAELGVSVEDYWQHEASVDVDVFTGAFVQQQMYANLQLDIVTAPPEIRPTLSAWHTLLGMRLVEHDAAFHLADGSLAASGLTNIHNSIQKYTVDLLVDADQVLKCM